MSWPTPHTGARRQLPAGAEGTQPSAGASSLSTGWPRRHWLTPWGVTVILATVLALALRLFILTRPGLLTDLTEYDDGVYLGAAVRLTQGALPYRDFAFVQPPGILLLMTPVAVAGRIFSTAAAMGIARVLTVCASTACVPLAGNLMRHRGTVATALTCGFLAVYPDGVYTARTLLLEPWMNVCCLIAANAAFSRGRLAGPGRLAWAGVALGFAGTVKFWAAAPAAALLALCLITRGQQPGRIRAYLAGLVAGFCIPIAPFVLAAPGAFVRGTLLYQASRVGTPVPMALRLAHLTGLDAVLNTAGRPALAAAGNSLAFGVAAPAPGAAVGWLPFVAIVVLVAVLGIGYFWNPRRPSQLEWYALAVTALATAAILGYSAFFYHYSVFVAPWLALALGGASACLPGRPSVRRTAVAVTTAAVLGAAAIGVHALAPLSTSASAQVGRMIPAHACVVTDEVSLLISANRFEIPPGCPDVIDSLAATLMLSHGVSIQGGAGRMASVGDAWRSILDRARYVWLSPGSVRRIPAGTWFREDFAPVSGYVPGIGQLFERRG